MATSSIFHDVVVDTPEDVEKLVDALGRAERAKKELPDECINDIVSEYIENADDIRRFFANY